VAFFTRMFNACYVSLSVAKIIMNTSKTCKYYNPVTTTIIENWNTPFSFRKGATLVPNQYPHAAIDSLCTCIVAVAIGNSVFPVNPSRLDGHCRSVYSNTSEL
jgi:hypothetical protein